jgi:hypothetical protein
MNMKLSCKYIMIATVFASVLACGGGSTSDPKTADRNELYAPNGLISVTRPSKASSIELRWSASNAEKDFKGYLVFGTTKTLSDISGKVAFPKDASDMLARFGVPRCEKNTGFFQAFGLSESKADCGDDVAKDAAETNLTAEEEETKDEDKPEVLANFIKCSENTETAENKGKVSLAATPPATDMQTCTVNEVYNGTELVPIVDGTPMTFVVFAVMGDDFDKISWSSNVVEDASSTTLSGFDGKDIKLDTAKFVKVEFAGSGSAITATAADAVACTVATTFCQILGKNGESSAKPAIYISRDNTSATHTQRIFVSIPTQGATSNIELQARGAQTSWENDKFSGSIPGDAPTSSYDKTGVTFVVYGNQVFDFKLTTGGIVNYGKIIFESVDYAGAKTTEATIKTTIIVQPGDGVKHYLW